MTSIVVGTKDLRQALAAVAPHAHQKREDLARVRLGIDPEHVTVTATGGNAYALAIASVWEVNDATDTDTVDIGREQVAKILSVFKTPKKKSGDPEPQLQIEVGDNYVTVSDVSGIPGIDGESLVLPRLTTAEQYPDIARLIARARARASRSVSGIYVSAAYLADFRPAARVYDHPLLLEARENFTSLLVTCGESFLGLLPTIPIGKDASADIAAWSSGWDARLPATGLDLATAAGVLG